MIASPRPGQWILPRVDSAAKADDERPNTATCLRCEVGRSLTLRSMALHLRGLSGHTCQLCRHASVGQLLAVVQHNGYLLHGDGEPDQER